MPRPMDLLASSSANHRASSSALTPALALLVHHCRVEKAAASVMRPAQRQRSSPGRPGERGHSGERASRRPSSALGARGGHRRYRLPTVLGQTCTVLFSMLRGRAVASALFSNGEYANKMGDVALDFASSPIVRAVGTQRDKPFA
jgi:hypothetical protein